jgi:aryl-alcohol dehydrogenase-like predicted oxidoreductase
MALPTRPLGSSGLHITTVGFGSWAVGGGGWSFGWGPQDDSDSIATMRDALDLGINWIDTAAVYGLGHSEEVVGRLLRDLPASKRPYVFTKCGLIWDSNNPMVEPRRVLKPDSIRRECEASLRRLGIERIDLYQFHWPDDTGTPVEDSWSEIVKLMKEGKVRAAGVSNFNTELLERCEVIRHVDSLQPPFSLINRKAAEKEIPWCEKHHTGVICYSPMQSGLLTDSFTTLRMAKLADDDWRRRASEFLEPNLNRNLALRNALRPIANEERHNGVFGGDRLDTRLAGRDGSDRGSAYASASGRLDPSRISRAHTRGSTRDCLRSRTHKSGGRPKSPDKSDGLFKGALRLAHISDESESE